MCILCLRKWFGLVPISVAKRKKKNDIFPSGKLFFLLSWKNLRYLQSNTYVYVNLIVEVHIAGLVDFGPKIIVEPSTCQNFYLHHVSNGLYLPKIENGALSVLPTCFKTYCHPVPHCQVRLLFVIAYVEQCIPGLYNYIMPRATL